VSTPAPRPLLATASIAVALAAADTYVVVLALTDMMAGVGLGVDALQRATPIISGFLLGYVAVLPLIGRIADLSSRQRVLLWCLAIFVVGSAVTALATDLPTLVAGRVVQGVGGGGLVPATLAIVADLWPADRRGMPLGVVGAVQELGSVLGPLLGAAVLAVSDWRMIFWLNAILGVVLAVLIVRTGGGLGARPRWGPLVVTAVGLAVTGLALAAPDALTTSVSLGLPFVPFGDATARLLTPIGVLGRCWWPSLSSCGCALPCRCSADRTCSEPSSSRPPWAPSSSPLPRPTRPARWSAPSATSCCPWPPSPRWRMPCTTAVRRLRSSRAGWCGGAPSWLWSSASASVWPSWRSSSTCPCWRG